jgi:hypothetical protein
VLVMGSMVNKRPYSRAEYVAVMIISLGIAQFSLLQVQKTNHATQSANASPVGIEQSNNQVGMLYLVLSLLLDGATGALQDR